MRFLEELVSRLFKLSTQKMQGTFYRTKLKLWIMLIQTLFLALYVVYLVANSMVLLDTLLKVNEQSTLVISVDCNLDAIPKENFHFHRFGYPQVFLLIPKNFADQKKYFLDCEKHVDSVKQTFQVDVKERLLSVLSAITNIKLCTK